MEPNGLFERMRQDHRRVLAELDEFVGAADEAQGRLPIDRLRALVGVLEAQFASHMEFEDRALFPTLGSEVTEIRSALTALQTEHRELRAMLNDLAARIAAPSDPARDEQIAVQAHDLVDLLRIHVRKEESLVFQLAERVLPDELLDRLQSQYLISHGGPESPAPPPRKEASS